jgi:type I restriction enzyme R subunit
VGFIADLAYKTRRLVEETATQDGLGLITKNVTFAVKTLESLKSDKGFDEGKVFNLVRGLQQEIDEDPNAAAILQPLKDRAERIIRDLEGRRTTGIAAMDLLAALAAERDAAMAAARDGGLTPKGFAVYWALRGETKLVPPGIDSMDIARESEVLATRFPNAALNSDEQRRLRANLYKPLLSLPADERTRLVEMIISKLGS